MHKEKAKVNFIAFSLWQEEVRLLSLYTRNFLEI